MKFWFGPSVWKYLDFYRKGWTFSLEVGLYESRKNRFNILRHNYITKTTAINMFRQITALNITKYFNKGFSLFIVIIFQFIICTVHPLKICIDWWVHFVIFYVLWQQHPKLIYFQLLSKNIFRTNIFLRSETYCNLPVLCKAKSLQWCHMALTCTHASLDILLAPLICDHPFHTA